MNIQEYIESGILEEYALGVLDDAGRTDVERLAAQHPEIRQELDEIMHGLDAYAQAHAVTPPSGMRERVLTGWQQAIQKQEAPVSPMTVTSAPAAAPAPAASDEAVVRQMPVADTSAAGRTRWLVAASVALLVLSALGNFLLYNRLRETEANLEVAQTEQSRYAATQQATLRESDERARQLSILRDEQFQPVELKGTPKAPDALARVYYNARTKAVYMDVRNLPALPAGKQYQLWALDNGKPVDAGVLAANTTAGDTIQQMKDIASAQAFAVTVEDAGGSPTPTLSTMTVVGNI
ncbi:MULTISPECIES: anti-sigma factor domain-containing protein [Hymenobacter]|uniref:Regulator of SigK n=1 Tax=Hymenobacter mucosus TaxID=1411120 RepID=A0A238VD48_9BACT|nr:MULTISPECIES: anti-sigma factor [Hymenobacter]SNR32342.1 Anti-sigma-K factor rskA [Hymenobacter mucosus]